MKVYVIIDSGGVAGKERANLQVAHVLKNAGVEVTLLVNAINAAIKEEIMDFRVFYIHFPRRLSGYFLFLKYVKAFFQTNIAINKLLNEESPDYLLVPTEIELAYLYPTLCRRTVKVVFRCGDSPLVNRKMGGRAKIYRYLWKRFILQRVNIVVCNAKFIQKQILESGRIPNKRDVLIYNYPPIRNIVKDNIIYNACTGAVRFGFLGRLVADKGVKELIEASFSLTRAGYHVMTYIGGGDNIKTDYSDNLHCLVQQNSDISEHIQFLGQVKDLQKFFNNVDVVVIPSIYPEPMANVATEAKFHSKPVIIFNQGGLPEIVTHQVDGYICDEVSMKGLQNGMRYYLDHKNLIIAHGTNAYKSIEKLDLSIDVFTKKWLDVFNR